MQWKYNSSVYSVIQQTPAEVFMAKNPDLQNNVEEEPSEGYASTVKDRVDEIWGA